MQYDTQKKFQDFIDTQLNEPQRKAVETIKGSVLVIAGAGSGKTRIITARITNLILNHQVHPRSIIALTFTNKAAKEMQERVGKFLQDPSMVPTVSTFHAYCLQLLKINQKLLPFENFVMMDSTDQQKLILKLLKKYELEKRLNVKQLLYTISTYKNSSAIGGDIDETDIACTYKFYELYKDYEQEKRLSRLLDFDDLLVYTLKLFQENKEFKQRFQKNVRHILVDEYQDTNSIQNELLRHMVLDDNQKLAIDSICAVGDEDQSIYSWRGATIDNILKFNKDFGQTETIKIEQNYRSTQHILDIANHVITHNQKRNHKHLWSQNSDGQKTILFECNSEFQEADMIAALIDVVREQEPLQSIAILYRTHYQSRVLEEAMLKANIPYKIIGGIQFYERKEIKDLIAYLKLFFNPFDRMSFFRVINCPTRGLGQIFEDDCQKLFDQNPFTSTLDIMKMVLDNKLEITKLTVTKHQAITSFINIFAQMPADITPLQALQDILEKTEYLNYLGDTLEIAESQVKKENIEELLRAVVHFQEEGIVTISDLLDTIGLMQDHMKKQDQSKEYVHMMTLHGAKGLEFNTIILPGLEDGIIPSTPSINESNVEEERRLFYVGLTRARKRIVITHCKTRSTYGQMNVQSRSRFLDEIPTDLIIYQPSTHFTEHQIKTYFRTWMHDQTPKLEANHAAVFVASVKKDKKPHPVTKTIKPQTAKPISGFKKMQSIRHKVFGLGMIQEVEVKGPITIVTVNFKTHGVKKIDSKFLEII